MTAENSNPADILQNLRAVKTRIDEAAHAAGRDPETVALVAISKTHGSDRIADAITAGHRLFGENRVQETEAKWPALLEGAPDVRLHLVGPLQSNKARALVANMSVEEAARLRREGIDAGGWIDDEDEPSTSAKRGAPSSPAAPDAKRRKEGCAIC